MVRKCILGVFAHPDDEVSGSGGTFVKYAREGMDVFVVTATRGEEGEIGAGAGPIDRQTLPEVREMELRAVLESLGAHPPVFLGYRDQHLREADFPELVDKVLAEMERTKPDVVIAFGPLGITRHDDHIAMHHATVEAFHRYRLLPDASPRLFYVALTKELGEQAGLDLEGPDVEPTVFIDITLEKPVKVAALRMYRSQDDAQWLANMVEASTWGDTEMYHQAYPPLQEGHTAQGFWE